MPLETPEMDLAKLSHTHAVELANQQAASQLELAKEQTRQTKIRYIVGAGLVAIISSIGAVYKVCSEANLAAAKLAAERQAFAHETMWQAVASFDDLNRKAPVLRYLALSGDQDPLVTWATKEMETVKVVLDEATQTEDTYQEKQEELLSAEARLTDLEDETLGDAQIREAIKNADAARRKLDSAKLKRDSARAAVKNQIPKPEQGLSLVERVRGGQVRSLIRADLSGAQLAGANLAGVDLRAANLRDANLRGARLNGARLGAANLAGADLSFADLQGAKLGRAILRGANLTSANLQNAVYDKNTQFPIYYNPRKSGAKEGRWRGGGF